MEWVKEAGGGGSFPPLPSSFFFWLSPHFPRRQNTEVFLPNPTETLATQATSCSDQKQLLPTGLPTNHPTDLHLLVWKRELFNERY